MIFGKIQEYACKHFKVTSDEILSEKPKVNAVYARIAMANLLHESGYTISEIADIFHVNNSLIFHYLSTFKDRLKYDVLFANTYNDFKEECN